MTKFISWWGHRLSEPSTWCALAIGMSVVGLSISQPILVYVGIIGAVLAFVLKEKGVY
jgi:hypothetical protein